MAQDNPHPNATFRHLKTYPNTEWLAEGKKRYRQVFEEGQTTYIYAELAINNKQFDRMSWFATVTFACYRADVPGEQGEEMCVIRNEYPVSKEQPIVSIREGWGNATPGHFWQAGRYVWHTWIDEHYMGQTLFHVQGLGSMENGRNPYCEAGELRMFEGPKDVVPQAQRRYSTTFVTGEVRYIWVELQLNNLAAGKDWKGEFFIRFFNEAMELKGENSDVLHVAADAASLELTSGWGAEVRGSWFPGKYSLAVVFMDQVIAHQSFTVLTNPVP